MSSKILIADDSLTIQKVITITLANTGYELTECLKEEDLKQKLQSSNFDLVLLDFNLSDSKTGYELSKEIKSLSPNVLIIVMLGTFDSVDESKFQENGISDKIIKPFESSKFIKKCKEVLDNKEIIEIKSEVNKTEKNVHSKIEETSDSGLDSWIVDAPKLVESEVSHAFDTEEISRSAELNLDPLKSEIEGWGFSAKVNLEEKFNKAFPSEIVDFEINTKPFEELPVLDENKHSNILDRLQSSSQFSIEEDSVVEDETDPSFEVPASLNRDLLSSIEDEISAEAFWAVDEVVPVKSEESDNIKKTNLDEITADLTEKVNAFKKENQAEYKIVSDELVLETHSPKEVVPEATAVVEVDVDQLVEKLQKVLLPQVEKMVKEFCRESAEKVSWEVIPDLAENLIKKEIKEIADSVKH